jgi:hypothetical protein
VISTIGLKGYRPVSYRPMDKYFEIRVQCQLHYFMYSHGLQIDI